MRDGDRGSGGEKILLSVLLKQKSRLELFEKEKSVHVIELIKPWTLLKNKTLTSEWPFFSWLWYKNSIEQSSIDYCLQKCVCNQGNLKSSTLEKTLGNQASGSRLEKTLYNQALNYVWISKYYKHRPLAPLRPESQQAIYSISQVSSKVSPGLEIQLQWTQSPWITKTLAQSISKVSVRCGLWLLRSQESLQGRIYTCI